MTLFGLLLVILFFGVLAYLISVAPFIDARFKQICYFVLLVAAIIYCFSAFGVFGHIPNPRLDQ